MNEEHESLTRLLRCELTAVNQQFIHVLALRDWGYTEVAERIMAVDYVDFPNVMGIIDYLVQERLPVQLSCERPVPGTSFNGILRSERALEERLSATIREAVCTGDRSQALVSAARVPREEYAAWLAERLDASPVDEPSPVDPFPESMGVFAHLIAIIEQGMVHAFVHRHEGEIANADAAWATSGAAMMQATEFVHLYTTHGTLPVPVEMPALRIASNSALGRDFDRRIADGCAREAAAAADACKDGVTGDLCRKIARCYSQLSHWKTGQVHPAADEIPTGFSSFEGSLGKFVRAAN